MDGDRHRGGVLDFVDNRVLANVRQRRSRLDRLAAAPLSIGRQRAGAVDRRANAHRGPPASGMLRRDRDGTGHLRGGGGDAAGFGPSIGFLYYKRWKQVRGKNSDLRIQNTEEQL